jgi:hypothetical protein
MDDDTPRLSFDQMQHSLQELEALARLGYLYRYRSVSGEEGLARLKQVVLDSEAYLCRYAALNDPFDGHVQFNYEATDDEIRSKLSTYITNEIAEVMGTTRDHIIDSLLAERFEYLALLRTKTAGSVNDLGVLCFSERPDDLLMWAYYADGHRGVCLKFRTSRLIGWEGCDAPLRVRYESYYPLVNYFKSGLRRCAILSWKLKRLQPLWCDGVGRRSSATDERSRRWAVSYDACRGASGVWARSGWWGARSTRSWS